MGSSTINRGRGIDARALALNANPMTRAAILAKFDGRPATDRVVLPYPPQANHLYAVARGRKVKSAKGREYQAVAAKAAIDAGMKAIDGPVSVSIDVYRPRRAGDLDNTLKAIFDCLKGVAWGDDKQVVEIRARRFDDKDNPRAEVTVAAAENA